MVQDRTGTIHEAVAHLCPFVLELLQLYRYLTDAPRTPIAVAVPGVA